MPLAKFDGHVSEETKVAMMKTVSTQFSIHEADRHQWTGTNNGIGGIFHRKLYTTVLSSWYSVKASCSLAIGRYTFQSTKTKLNGKLLKVVDGYHYVVWWGSDLFLQSFTKYMHESQKLMILDAA